MDKKIAEIRNLIDSGKLEEAEIALSDALKQYPDSQELLHLQAELKLKTGDIFWENSDIDKALESYTEALEINPNDRNIVLKCGEVLSSLEQHDTAKRLYSSYLQKYPEDNEIVQAQKKLEESTLLKTVSSDEIQQIDGQKEIKVSAIVSTYNSEKFIRGCLEDLINQTLYKKGELEIIVVNSGSQQNEDIIVKEFQQRYPNINYIKTEERETVYAAWNRGIRTASGKYITNANTDDRHRHDAFEVMVNILDKIPEIGLVYADVIITETENETFENHTPVSAFLWLDYSKELLTLACFMGPQPMWRKSLHEKYGYFDETFNSSGDWEFWLRIAEDTKMLHIPEFLGLYLLSSQSAEHRNLDKRIQEDISISEKYVPRYLATLKDVDHALSLLQTLEQKSPDNPTFSLSHMKVKLLNQKSAILGQQYHQVPSTSIPESMKGTQDTLSKSEKHREQCEQKETSKAFKKQKNEGMVSIILHISNNQEHTRKCAKSIRNYTPEKHEVIFVSADPMFRSDKLLKKLVKKNKNYRIVENPPPPPFSKGGQGGIFSKEGKGGFSSACNRGIKAASGEYILILTDDVVVTEDWLSGMLECLNSSLDIGIVGPMTVNVEGPQRIAKTDYTSLDYLNQFAKEFRERNRYRRVPSRKIEGICMLFKQELIEKIGLFDESFQTYEFADDDYSIRSVIEGYKNFIAVDVFVHHFEEEKQNAGKNKILFLDKRKFTNKWRDVDEKSITGQKLLIINSIELADELSQKGQIGDAVEVLLEGLERFPVNERTLYSLSELLIENNRYDDVIYILENMSKEKFMSGEPYSDNFRWLELIGYCKEGKRHYEEAEKYADEALTLNNSSAKAWNLKGLIASRKERYTDAEEFFKKALEHDRGFGEAYTNLGALKWFTDIRGDNIQSREDAFNLSEKAFVLSPTTKDIIDNYNFAVNSLDRSERAEAVLRDAVSLYPSNKRLKYMLIDTLNKNKKYEDALNLAEELITWPGADNNALFLAIKLRAKVGAQEVDTSSKDTISLCMIVKNEEDNIGSCLKKIKPLVDEMIVVDTGSTDKTKDLAKAFGAKVFDFPWNNNFSDARNFSSEKASGKWILILDADEVIAHSDFDSVKKLVKKSGDRIVAYHITTRNYVTPINAVGWVGNEGQYLNEEAGTGWFPSMKVRLFRKDERIRFEKPIHEMVEYSLVRYGLPFEQCDIPIHHYGKLDTGKLSQKGKEYYELGKKKLAEDGENDVLAIRELAIQAMELGLHEEALEYWKKVARIEPKRTQAHYGIGHCCFCLGKYEDARIPLKKAVELDPNYKDAIILYAHCEIYTGDAEITIPLLEKILMNDPSSPRILLRLAFAYFCSGEKEKGLKIVNTLRNINIRCTEYFSDCAKDLISIKRYEYAKSLLEAALETNNADNETKNLLEECRNLLKENPTP